MDALRTSELTIEPLSPAIGIEVRGIDLSQPLSDAAFSRIRSAWEDNCIALFRGQSLDEQQQAAFAERFGPIQLVNRTGKVLYISNVRKDGKLIGALPDGEMHFHSDQVYVE